MLTVFTTHPQKALFQAAIMITLSLSIAMVEGLHQELTRALGLNDLHLYKIVQGLLWVHEGQSLKRCPAAARGCQDGL